MCPLLLLLLLFFASTVDALVFELPSGRVKCVMEDLYRGTISVAHYRVADAAGGFSASSGGGRIAVRLSDPKGESIYHAENLESGNFAFLAVEAGRYTACFWSPNLETSRKVPVDLDWRTGVAGKDWHSFLKKDRFEATELELEKLEEWINWIQEEARLMRQREEETQRLNGSINSNIGWYILFFLVACGGVAALRYCLYWCLKTFFEFEIEKVL